MIRSSKIRSFALAVLLAAAAPVAAGDATQADADSAIAAAEAARAAAAEAKSEWTTTEVLISEAKAAVEAGKFGDAVALAQKAEAEGKAAVDQARREEEGWKASVVR